jgi:hypothetical protein
LDVVVTLVCTIIESALAMDMLQPKKHQFIGYLHIVKSWSFCFLGLMMMKLDMMFTKHG